MNHALIVDDDRDSATMMAALVATENFTASTAHTLRDARRSIAARQPDLILLDLQLPDGNGMDLFEDQTLLAHSQVVLITGHASLDSSIQALRLGAADYLVKPVSPGHLNTILANVSRPPPPPAEFEALRGELQRSGRFGQLWGRSAPMQAIYHQISRVAGSSATVLITGESGTGKELVARSVHDLSRRRGGPFLAINCGAISPQLIESEMFGHEKGSFTGAERQHQGFFERAHGGTLFLDEITEMPLELQVKLLRVLETGSFMRVGASQLQETDIRLIAATNRSPEEAVARNRLREDLYYRLAVFPVALPPLRDRLEDVPLLAGHFLAGLNAAEGASKRFAPAALTRLAAWHWPGNVRELRNAVHRAFVMEPGEVIGPDDLPLRRLAGAAADGGEVAVAPPVPDAPDAPPAITIPVGTSMEDAERQLIFATLKHYHNQKERTAAALGVSLKTLYNRLKDYASEADQAAPADTDPRAASAPRRGES
ncbi:MAG: sigma-54 dependent transcriptional regulator [Candidatus Dactylopiibacterium sp.]|nr:sigma-54 dependent transcriptional regulator [Candidatus Dactylopiibacterium sp.]